MKPRITVYFNSTMAHASQIFTGLELLKIEGRLELDYKLAVGELPNNKMRMEYQGKQVIFDMADDSVIDQDIYQQCDAYVKRMLLKVDRKKYEKVIPFGLNYSVMVPNSNLRGIWTRNPSLLGYSIKYNPFLSKLLDINDAIYNVQLENMEGAPNEDGDIIFGTRLWNPMNNEIAWKKEERKKINLQRIAIIRRLKEIYGPLFKGGVEKSSLSQIICPDLLISKAMSNKKAYLDNLKGALIGIANFGLEGSIGWKFPEYIAHGMAIITTPIDEYLLHGELLETQNYLKFESVEECLEAVDLLVNTPSLRKKMQKENCAYYQQFLHPKRKMELILNDLADL
ncbi:hypothetical protein LZF95_11355 [Algoriphagus sp. AGSA1]|uniref:glycosyltransferase n=1 Tax=Algoriphagus sp. AGSA1 TaxID=2907213 RepID=UPI001F33DDF5|nr:hypothetical protein [Algoriphagus sp. AGSA1]MCE7055273.1 hypothetical protein [Algoriphagus sp. AGSA1]